LPNCRRNSEIHKSTIWDVIGTYWPITKGGLEGGFDFVGPWVQDVLGGHGPILDRESSHGWGYWSRDWDLGPQRRYVFEACKHAVSISDIIFCWLPHTCQPYGSIWELGYASALNKIIIIAEDLPSSNQWWLARESADWYLVADNSWTAWDLFVKYWHNTPALREQLNGGQWRYTTA
jgi:hypothetical protein